VEHKEMFDIHDSKYAGLLHSYRRFIDIIRFTEDVSTAIHGLYSEQDIFSAVEDKFQKSNDYSTVILKLDDAKTKLQIIAMAMPREKVRAAEKAGGFSVRNFSINLDKSTILRRAVVDQETVYFSIKDLMLDMFPRILAQIIAKVTGMGNRWGVVTPLRVRGEVIGVFSMSCPELAEDFIPTAINLAQHISYALELAREYAEVAKGNEAIRKGRDEYLAITDLTGDIIVKVDMNGRRTFVNETACTFWGKSQIELLGTAFIDSLHPDDQEKTLAVIEDLKRRKTLKKVVNRQATSAGWRSVEWNRAPLFDSEGDYCGFQATGRDIAERIEAEKAKRDSESKYRTIFEGSADGIVITEIETRMFKYANRAFCRMLGYEEHEIAGKSILDIHPPETLDAVIDEFLAQASGEKPLAESVPCLRKDGAVIYADINTQPLVIDGVKCNVGFFRDITARLTAEQNLKFKNIILSTQQETSIDGILVVDENGKIISFNRRFVDMWGIPYDVIESKSDERALQSVLHKLVNPEEFISKVKHLYEVRDETSRDVVALKDGRTFDRYSAPMSDADAKCYGRVWYFRDITGEKRAQEEKALLEERLRQSEKLRAIGELAGGIAHDFNNMLGAVAGYADLIAEENKDSDGGQKDPVLGKRIDTILRASNRAADLIKKLLAFSRRGKYRNMPVDVHEIIGDVLALIEGNVNRNIVLKNELNAQSPLIQGDPSQIQNVIFNLVVNGSDAMKQGGELLIATRNENLGKDSCFLDMEPGDYLVVSVRDTGIGMDEQTKARIFEPFFSTKGMGGTGLGLASVYGTMKSHRGGVSFESEPGRGSCFNIYIPVKAAAVTTAAPIHDDTGRRSPGIILLADDEEMVRDIVRETLSECGYTVYTCSNGEEAVEWYTKYREHISLVILDMVMPVMSGFDCYKNIKQINPGVKVLLMSGYSINEKVQKVLQKGDVEFIEKPFTRDSLSQQIAKMVNSGEAAAPKSRVTKQVVA